MSQHEHLATVWQHLQGHRNVPNTLRHIIGQLAVDSIVGESDSHSVQQSTRSIIWIKTIFDLQRSYLNGITAGAAECPPHLLPCLLPPELLYSTLLYLVNVKSTLYPAKPTPISKELARPRLILTQTLLSGLRLLLLRKDSWTARDRWRLQTAVKSAWHNDQMLGVESFIVCELFAALLDALQVNSPSRENPYLQEWINARLPTYDSGLYPLDCRPETFVAPLIRGVIDEEEDWLDAYWVLYDCLWTAESAIVQRHVDLRRKHAVVSPEQPEADTDEILEQLWHTRTSLITTIFHITWPMTPPSFLLESLAMLLLDWNSDLDDFLASQGALAERGSLRPAPLRTASYGKLVRELSPYYEFALKEFTMWLPSQTLRSEPNLVKQFGMTSDNLQEVIQEWVKRITPANAETQTRNLAGPLLPVYAVDCPKLHMIPRKFLEHQLRWCDKWAYDSIRGSSPIVRWKDGIQCPSCTGEEKIKCARLIEPFQHLSSISFQQIRLHGNSPSQCSVGEAGSYDPSSGSGASRSMLSSETESVTASSVQSLPTTAMSLPPHSYSKAEEAALERSTPISQLPVYSESPVSPAASGSLSQRSQYFDSPVSPFLPTSPFQESLNVPIPKASRLSMELPIPIEAVPIRETVIESIPEVNIPLSLPSPGVSVAATESSTWSGSSLGKTKSSSSRTVRLANTISMRRKPTTKDKDASPLPRDPMFNFSSSGHSLLLWGKGGNHLVRFDFPSNDASAAQGCRYDVAGIEAAAAGNHKCAVLAASGLQKRRLALFSGITPATDFETEVEVSTRTGDICLAMSRNDKLAAISVGDSIHLFRLDDDGIKSIAFHHQIHVHELKGGVSLKRPVPAGRPMSSDANKEEPKTDTGWFGVQSKGLSSKEVAEEQQRQGAVISRKLYFSSDSTRLVVATHLGDHCVYIDVYDCTREPVGTISEQSRSFKLPPWTLNDGDLTSVFYDSTRRNAIVTAFLGKEYPVLVPFPGYDALQNETYGTKVVHAAQSPSGTSFIVANAMTEIIQFEYNGKGTLTPHKLKKAAGKISTSVFKPGSIALAMPLENVLQAFWIKSDGRCMLRSIKLGSGETFKDYDVRSHYDRLMTMTTKPVITKAPTLNIPEMG